MDTAARRVRPSPLPAASPSELREAIRRRAEELYELNGRIQGRDVQNWLQAEAEVHREFEGRPARKAAIVVKVQGVRYVGEYDVAAADGYTPGELASADEVQVRLDGDKMYVKRPNDKELETKIVSKSG
jgi:hypothetical protein